MIGGFSPCSFIDFPKHLAAVVFTQGCNLKCKYCHNPELCALFTKSSSASSATSSLDSYFKDAPVSVFATVSNTAPVISLDNLSHFLKSRTGKLTGVVISGGEPTIHKKLPHLLSIIKSLDFAIKLDTNGTHPSVVQHLINEKLVNYVAVDIKIAPGSSSKWLCGIENQAELALETLSILVKSHIQCEARTTVVGGKNDLKNLDTIARHLASINVKTWRMQSVNNTKTLDPLVSFSPPDPNIILTTINMAKSLGIDAILR